MSKVKTYFHRTPGAKFYMPDGVPLTFSSADGKFETDRLDIQQELDRIADVPTSHVYTKQIVQTQEERTVAHELAQTAVGAFDADKKISGNPETQKMHMPIHEKPKLSEVAKTGGGDLANSLAKAAEAIRQSGTGANKLPQQPPAPNQPDQGNSAGPAKAS